MQSECINDLTPLRTGPPASSIASRFLIERVAVVQQWGNSGMMRNYQQMCIPDTEALPADELSGARSKIE